MSRVGSPSSKNILLLGAGLVVAVGVFLYVITRSTPVETNTTPRRDVPISTFIPTPVEYQTFFGQIESVSESAIVVKHIVLTANGNREELSQTATVSRTTKLQARAPDGTSFRYRTIALNDLKPGNAIIVAADTNIAGETAFLASHIQRIDQ